MDILDEKTNKGKKAVILAVDDKPEILMLITEILKDRYSVIGVTSADKALQAIKKHSPALFILDIEMPEIDGLQLAKILRLNKKFLETPIIFLTGKNTREDVNSAIISGCSDYILKPINKELLLKKISRFV